MRPATKLATLTLLSALATPAAAEEIRSYRHYDDTNFRVFDITGADHLNLRARASTSGRVVAEISFDQRGLAATGQTRNGWVELRYWDEDGRAITGWASARYLEEDQDGERTTYAVTGLARYEGLEIRREEGHGRRVGTLAYNATGVQSQGACRDLYCPIRFSDRSGSLTGWVPRESLKVERFAVRPPEDEPYAYEKPNTSDNSWDAVRQRREARRERWRTYWRRLWTSDRHASY